MTNLSIFELTQYARDLIKDPSMVKKAVSIAAGIAFARSTPLPTSEVDYAESYYNDIVAASVDHKAVDFNEQCLVDIDLVRHTTRAFWLVRYYNAYPLKTIPVHFEDGDHFMSALAGVGHLINPDTFDFCQANNRRIIALVNRIREATEK